MREATFVDRVVDELTERGAVAVHRSRAEAIEAIARQAAAQAARPEALAVTVATNEDAAALNEAVRNLRVQQGAVDDARTATGMEGVPIGAGDRIVTRRNDTATAVANREAWTVEAITEDGTVLARSVEGGNRHVRLEPGYLRDAVQLGYATTDYGNQGVTTDASVTWVGDATSAGGLYVGATRGRYENVLHIVAEDAETARQKLIAAAERDRADRGLDVARQRAQADAVPVPVQQPEPERRSTADAAERAVIEQIQRRRAAREDAARRQAASRVPVPEGAPDPATWRSAAELDAAAAAIEARLAQGLRSVHDRPVMSDEQRAHADAADRARAADARAEAAWHRSEIERMEASRAALVEEATAEYFAARDAARTIEAGPGRLHRRAAEVEVAQAQREATARRWSDSQLPGTQWTDATVRHHAEDAVQRIIGPDIRMHATEAREIEKQAGGIEAQITRRARDHELTLSTNETLARRRDVLVSEADRSRTDLAEQRAARDELTEEMTPEEVAAADATRDALVKEEARELRRAHERDQVRHAPEQLQPPTPHIERGGPGLGR